MINKAFDKIAKEDIEGLQQNSVPESKTIEYKLTLPGNSDSNKKEFLADISSFANASGGDLLFGVKEKDGIPVDLLGLDGINVDQEKLRLESLIRDGIETRIPGVHIQAIEGFSKGPVLHIRIPKSWLSPHMVIFRNTSRFYSRNSAGKFQMDVTEIRSAFLMSDSLSEKIRLFREERISKIINEETPVSLASGAKAVLHLLPISKFEYSLRADISPIGKDFKIIGPISNSCCDGWGGKHNFDGYRVAYHYRGSGRLNERGQYINQKYAMYIQVFRDTAIEIVEATMLEPYEEMKYISEEFFHEFVKTLTEYINVLKKNQVALPIFTMMSLLNVKGYKLLPQGPGTISDPIDRDILLLPDILIESYEKSADDLLKETFDTIYQACGLDSCSLYDENGKLRH